MPLSGTPRQVSCGTAGAAATVASAGAVRAGGAGALVSAPLRGAQLAEIAAYTAQAPSQRTNVERVEIRGVIPPTKALVIRVLLQRANRPNCPDHCNTADF